MNNITHVLYAPPKGPAREEAEHLLTESKIEFVVLVWPHSGPDHGEDDVTLVTSVGEFDSLEGMRFYVAQRFELASIADKIRNSISR